jgi:predicted nucleic acid-binding protein
MPVVIDASVAVKWFLLEPGSDAATALLEVRDTLSAPDLVLAEVGNVLWKRCRQSLITAEEALSAVGELRRMFSHLYPLPPLAHRATDLSIRLDHPAYDCYYLALAESLDATLVTADRRLADLAGSDRLGIPVKTLA